MSIKQSVKTSVMKRQGGLCVGIMPDGEVCGIDLADFKAAKALHIKLPKNRSPVEFDHIEPRADGGGDEAENIQALCGWCHHRKTEIERADWEAPSRSVFTEQLLAKGNKGINGPRKGAAPRPSQAMRLMSKRPVLKCG